MSDFFNVVTIALSLVCWFFIIRKFVADRFAKVKTVYAEVFDKYEAGTFSKYPRVFRGENYIVVFATKDKKLSFPVSEFSYNNYKVNEKGILKYKGNRIISFQ